MISSASCNNSVCGEATNNVGDLKYYIRRLETKVSLFNVVVQEKEEIQKQLGGLSAYMEDIIKKQKDMFVQLTNGHEELWCMYQNTKRDLDRSKSEITNISAELIVLNEKNTKPNNHAKQLLKQNEHLDEKILLLEKRLYEELNNIDRLKCKSESQKACLEQKSEELDRNKQTAEEQRDQLKKLQSDLQILKSKLDTEQENYAQLKNETAITKKKIVKEKETLESQIETMEKERVEMERVFLEQNYKIQELNKKTLDLKQLKDEIKCTLENERSQADERIESLKKGKWCLEATVEALSCQMDACIKESARLKYENDKMNKTVKDLQNALEVTIKCNEEKRQAAVDEIQSISNEKHKLKFELQSMDRKICRLEEDLINAKQLCTAETENVCELKRTIDGLQFSQKLMSNSMNACSNQNVDNQLADFSKVLDHIMGIAKNPMIVPKENQGTWKN